MDTLDDLFERAKASRAPAQVIELFPARALAEGARVPVILTLEEAQTLCHSYAALSAFVDFTIGGSDELLARVEDMLRISALRIQCIKRLRANAV